MKNIFRLIALIITFAHISCTKATIVKFETEGLLIAYSYDSQIISLNSSYSIERTVEVTRMQKSQNLKFELFSDIENLDEARFFKANNLKFNDITYKETLLIKDPSAFVILDLINFKIIYNGHGEDIDRNRFENLPDEICLGKITNKRFYKGNCKIEF